MRADEFGCRPLNGRAGLEQVRIARDAVVVGPAAERVGVDRDIAGGGIEQHAAFEAVVDGRRRAARLEARQRYGAPRASRGQAACVGMRLLVELTTPPIDCEP